MIWGTQQEQALLAVKQWLRQPGKQKQVFRLFGYAGTGKTTLAKEIAGMAHGSVCFAAFTGKAASVMRKKGCVGAQTIHSLIYVLDKVDFGEPKFILNSDSEVKHSKLVIIDECSMVDERIGRDLLSYGTKILVIGDPAQLPPVSGAGFFTAHDADYLLTEVHRQAAENPIIRLSMQIRNGDGIEIGSYGTVSVVARSDVNAEMVLSAEQVIVGTNKTREAYNNRIRTLLGRIDSAPVGGDKLICLRNDREKGLFNGTMWSVEKAESHKDYAMNLAIRSFDEPKHQPKNVRVLNQFFDGRESELNWKVKQRTQELTFGYAITCHKSQGSQWDTLLVFNESGYFRDNEDRWLYTAVTRAAERLTIVSI